MTPEPTPTCPFIHLAKGIPPNWPDGAQLIFHEDGLNTAPAGTYAHAPTVGEWRALLVKERELAAANDRIRHLEETLDVERVTEMESQASRLAAALEAVRKQFPDLHEWECGEGRSLKPLADQIDEALTSWRGKGGEQKVDSSPLPKIPSALPDGRYFWRQRSDHHWSMIQVIGGARVSGEVFSGMPFLGDIGGQLSRAYELTEPEIGEALSHQSHQARACLDAIKPAYETTR